MQCMRHFCSFCVKVLDAKLGNASLDTNNSNLKILGLVLVIDMQSVHETGLQSITFLSVTEG